MTKNSIIGKKSQKGHPSPSQQTNMNSISLLTRWTTSLKATVSLWKNNNSAISTHLPSFKPTWRAMIPVSLCHPHYGSLLKAVSLLATSLSVTCISSSLRMSVDSQWGQEELPLAENGIPPSLIQFMGCWSSDAFFIYIQKSPVLIQVLLYSKWQT